MRLLFTSVVPVVVLVLSVLGASFSVLPHWPRQQQ